MKRYKIHTAYINANGEMINEGEYNEDQFNLAEARNKSIVTNVYGILDVKKETPKDDLPVMKFNMEDSNLIKEIKIEPTQTVVSVNKLKINSASLEDLTELNSVGKATAEKVIAYRKEKRIESYAELDKLAPLKKKSWEDVCAIDFEIQTSMTLENSVRIDETN